MLHRPGGGVVTPRADGRCRADGVLSRNRTFVRLQREAVNDYPQGPQGPQGRGLSA